MLALARQADAPDAVTEPGPPVGRLVKFRPLRDRRSERLTRPARERLAALAADRSQGWAQQQPEVRTTTARPNRWRRLGSRYDWPAVVLFLAVVGLLIAGMVQAHGGEQGAVTQTQERNRP